MDKEFNQVSSKTTHITVNTAAEREQVGYIKIEEKVVK